MSTIVQTAVIGGGLAGLLASQALLNEGEREIILFDRNPHLGGLLRLWITPDSQGRIWCEEIEKLQEELLSGPLQFSPETEVLKVDFQERVLECINPHRGWRQVKVKNLVLATGSREKGLQGLAIDGRPLSGILGARSALEILSQQKVPSAKKIIILGSSPLAIEVARQFQDQGAKIMGVIEAKHQSSILPRDREEIEIREIPYYPRSRLLALYGRDKIQGLKMEVPHLDGRSQLVRLECDNLILAREETPEITLLNSSPIEIDSPTGGPQITPGGRTSLSWVFALGDLVYPHSNLDTLAAEARLLAREVLKKDGLLSSQETVTMNCGPHIAKIIPQKIPSSQIEGCSLSLFPYLPDQKVFLEVVNSRGELLLRQSLKSVDPGRVIRFDLPQNSQKLRESREIEVRLLK